MHSRWLLNAQMTCIKNEQINIIPILIRSMKKIKQSKVCERERERERQRGD